MTAPTQTPAGFDPAAFPRKVNLGCGWDIREGHLNIDFIEDHSPDLVADVRNLSMLPDNFYDEVVAHDILEHLERSEVDGALREWARITAVGGSLVVRVPDIIGLARMLGDEHTVERHSTMIHCLYGTQAYNGDYHLAGFTELTLRHSLHEAGFIVRSLERVNGWLFDCVAERVEAPGIFHPGTLPFLALCDHPTGQAEPASSAGASRFERAASAVGRRVPPSTRGTARKVWSPVRSTLRRIGIG